MKKCACFLGILFLLKPVFPLFSYVLNYQYIVENLCVNREKPQLSCNGKCHLAKELAKEVDEEKSAKDSSKKEVKHILEWVSSLPEKPMSAVFDHLQTADGANFAQARKSILSGHSIIVIPPPNIL